MFQLYTINSPCTDMMFNCKFKTLFKHNFYYNNKVNRVPRRFHSSLNMNIAIQHAWSSVPNECPVKTI